MLLFNKDIVKGHDKHSLFSLCACRFLTCTDGLKLCSTEVPSRIYQEWDFSESYPICMVLQGLGASSKNASILNTWGFKNIIYPEIPSAF